MLPWLTANSEWLNLIASWAMVAIWIVYLQVFLHSYRRQAYPKIVINRAAGSSLEAACFVSNMSSDAIYIESVIVRIGYGSDTFACTVTDFEFFDGQSRASDPKARTFQGPLPPSQYTSLGTFKGLIETVARRTGRDRDEPGSSADAISVEVTVVADYASEHLLIGAKRSFSAHRKDGQWKLTADTPSTHQIRSPRERKHISATVADME